MRAPIHSLDDDAYVLCVQTERASNGASQLAQGCTVVFANLCAVFFTHGRSDFGVVPVASTSICGSILSVVVRHTLHAHAFGISSTLQAGFSPRFLSAREVTRISPVSPGNPSKSTRVLFVDFDSIIACHPPVLGRFGETNVCTRSWRHSRVERPPALAPGSASPGLNACPFLLIPVKVGSVGRGSYRALIIGGRSRV